MTRRHAAKAHQVIYAHGQVESQERARLPKMLTVVGITTSLMSAQPTSTAPSSSTKNRPPCAFPAAIGRTTGAFSLLTPDAAIATGDVTLRTSRGPRVSPAVYEAAQRAHRLLSAFDDRADASFVDPD